MTCIAGMVITDIQTLNIDRLHAKQKKDIHCGNLATESYINNKNSFNLVMISPDGLLQKQQYVHGIRYDDTIAQHSIVPVILHEFHNSKGYPETIHTFGAIRRFYWWPKLCQDIVKHISQCSIYAKILPNMVKYPQQHLEIPHVPMAVLAMDFIGHLPITSRGH